MRILAILFIALFLGACMPNFDEGHVVRADVGRVQGDPCTITVQFLTARRTSITARLQTPECQETR